MRNGRNNFGEERYSEEVIAFLRTDKSFSQLFPSRYAGMLANAFIGPIRLQGIHEPQIITETITLSITRDLKRWGGEMSQFEHLLVNAIRSNEESAQCYAEHRMRWEDLSDDEKKVVKRVGAKRIHKMYMMSKSEKQKVIPFLQI